MENKKKILLVLAAIALVVALIFVPRLFTNNNPPAEVPAESEKQNAYDYMVLVNKQNKLPDDWEEKVVLKEGHNIYGETLLVEEKALAQFELV